MFLERKNRIKSKAGSFSGIEIKEYHPKKKKKKNKKKNKKIKKMQIEIHINNYFKKIK